MFDCRLFVGILSLVQMSRIKLFGGYYLGTGLITVVGTSFATLSTANAVRHMLHNVASPVILICILVWQIFNVMYTDGTCPSTVSDTGVVTRGPCPDAYGKVLGRQRCSCGHSYSNLHIHPQGLH